MTPTRLLRSLFVAVVLVSWATVAQAQQPPAPRPSFSPYLNLLRSGNPTYLNYYGLVRPQLDSQRAIQGLQGQFQNLSAPQSSSVGADGQLIPVTGQPFGYFTHQGFFLNNRGGGGGIGGGGIGGAGARGPVGGAMPNRGGQGNRPAVGGIGR